MSNLWSIHDAGLFSLELPPQWRAEQPTTGTLLLQDPANQVAVALTAISRPRGAVPRRGASQEVITELRAWIDAQHHCPSEDLHLLPATRYAVATAEAARKLSTGMPRTWVERLLNRKPAVLWRYWAVLNPHLLLLISCNGKVGAVEKLRLLVDRIITSIQLPERDVLLGRHFTETVVSLARTWFPQTAVNIVDDAHLQFGGKNVSLINLHRRYLASPEDLPTHVRSFLAAVQEEQPATSRPNAWQYARERVYPVILTSLEVHGAPVSLLCDTWINGLFVGYVMTEPALHSVVRTVDRAVSQEDLAHWNITPETLHEQALHNLIISSHDYTMQGQKGEGFTMLALGTNVSIADMELTGTPEPQVAPAPPVPPEGGPMGDRRNAARILLPELYRKLREHLGTTFYAAIPARHLLLAFSSTDEEIISRLRAQVARDFARVPTHLALSPKLFLVTPDGIAGDPAEQEDFAI